MTPDTDTQLYARELTVVGSCHHDCPDTCSWEVTVVDGVATQLRGAAAHPITQGTLCPKVNRFLDRVYHPERLLTPLRRVGAKGAGEFEAISWHDAITEIVGTMRPLMDAGRAESILQFSFAGTQGTIQMGVLIDRLFDAIGASDIRRELCGTTTALGCSDVLGEPFGVDPESLRHSRTIVLWGTNTLLTNRHLWAVIDEARAAGATVVVIDPVRTETARRADEFMQIRPGTDVALVLALVHVLNRDDLVDRAWIEESTTGWNDLLKSSESWMPQRAAEITGVAADRIEWLAHEMATHTPTAVRVLVGPEHREHGRDIMRAIAMLPAVLGSWRDVGGGLSRSTQIWHTSALALDRDRPPRRLFNMASLAAALVDDSLEPPIEMLVVHNSNPAVILPDQNQVLAALEREDLFTVVIEQFMTDTACYADIVLPATTQLEQLDLGIAWGHLYLSLNQPAIEPLGEALPNTEIARRLAAAMGLNDPRLHIDDETLIRELLDSGHPWLQGITYERLAAQGWARLAVDEGARPHVDDVPGIPVTPMVLGTLDFRVGSETVIGSPELAQRFPLTLISRKQHQKFLNANYGGFDSHLPSAGEPMLQMHADDAEERDLATGNRVVVFNDRGSLTLTLEVTDVVQRGLVAIPFGWWNRSTPEGLAVNALTNATVGDDGVGSAFFHESLVQVVRAERVT